jgi:hypothetical protein
MALRSGLFPFKRTLFERVSLLLALGLELLALHFERLMLHGHRIKGTGRLLTDADELANRGRAALRPDWRRVSQQPEDAGQDAPRYSSAHNRFSYRPRVPSKGSGHPGHDRHASHSARIPR